jgi:hypothetical protein
LNIFPPRSRKRQRITSVTISSQYCATNSNHWKEGRKEGREGGREGGSKKEGRKGEGGRGEREKGIRKRAKMFSIYRQHCHAENLNKPTK